MENRVTEHVRLVVFFLDHRRYGLHLGVVEKVLHAVDITPLPKAPDIVLGLVNVRGRIAPVLNIRKRFHLPEKETELQDHFIVARTSKRAVVIPVDSTEGVTEISSREIVDAKDASPGLDYVQGVVKLDDGMLLIHDLERFLSLEEEKTLEGALKGRS